MRLYALYSYVCVGTELYTAASNDTQQPPTHSSLQRYTAASNSNERAVAGGEGVVVVYVCSECVGINERRLQRMCAHST